MSSIPGACLILRWTNGKEQECLSCSSCKCFNVSSDGFGSGAGQSFDHLPVELGRGERLWTSHHELLDRFHVDAVPSPSGVTHLLFWHR